MSTRTLFTSFRPLGRILSAVLLACCGMASAHADCWVSAGQRHGIDPLLLMAIASVESSMNPKAVNRNKDGTWDLGLMQINSSNFAALEAQGFGRDKLVDPCASIEAGAIMLAGFIKRHGYTWTAVGAYNAGSSATRTASRKHYATKIWNAYRKMYLDADERERALAKWRSFR